MQGKDGEGSRRGWIEESESNVALSAAENTGTVRVRELGVHPSMSGWGREEHQLEETGREREREREKEEK